MVLFNCDYNEGAEPAILRRLSEINFNQYPGYGEDSICREAEKTIVRLCKAPAARVHFLIGGTQTNLTLIDAALRPHECVLSASTGHINVHETGSIEACGHKILALPTSDGKITGDAVRRVCRDHIADASHEHTAKPRLVYVSFPTELGTLYTKAELSDLRRACDEYGLLLFLDGARLGYGLASRGNDLTLPDIAALCDAFYIGGTKQGALFGEALVITYKPLGDDFRYIMKQKGAMLAKGWLIGVQFDELLRNGLYFESSRRAIALADKLRAALTRLGCKFYVENTTNQLFPILPNSSVDILSKSFGFTVQARVDDTHTAIRFCTGWATKEENVDLLISALNSLPRDVDNTVTGR